MTDQDRDHSASATDAELIERVRCGDLDAYTALFRRHYDVALRQARRLTDAHAAEDLVSEAFTKVLDLLRRGRGPDRAFRAYLLTTVRRLHMNHLRAAVQEYADD